jgi:hypothetical protein
MDRAEPGRNVTSHADGDRSLDMVGITPREAEPRFILQMAYEQGTPGRNMLLSSPTYRRLLVVTGVGLDGSVSYIRYLGKAELF